MDGLVDGYGERVRHFNGKRLDRGRRLWHGARFRNDFPMSPRPTSTSEAYADMNNNSTCAIFALGCSANPVKPWHLQLALQAALRESIRCAVWHCLCDNICLFDG